MNRIFTTSLLLLFLAACSGPPLPFEKNEPVGGQSADLVRPPWEAYVKAGPGAENDLDLETLNGPGAGMPEPPVQAAPPPIAESGVVEAAEASPKSKAKPADKAALTIRSVAVPTVTGAKGKGNAELTAALRRLLSEAGWPVISVPAADALTIRGSVALGAPRGAVQTVRLKWVVLLPNGGVLGDVAQSNDVPAGALDASWGENAQFAAEAATEGLFKLIQKYR